MKLKVVATVVGIVLLLNGCNDHTPAIQKKKSFDRYKKQIVKHYKDAYYYRPNNSWSYKLSANSANLNNVASGGILTCKENDIWYRSNRDTDEEKKIRYKYTITLSKSQLNKMEEDPEYIPRRDSKEFRDLIEIDTLMAQQGLIGCSSQIPKEWIEKKLPQVDVISIPE